jgi:SAM-dependent methyltransferase
MAYSEQEDMKKTEEIFFRMRRDFASCDYDFDFEKAWVLDAGGAGGMLGGLISKVAAKTIVASRENEQVIYDGQFPKLLKEKFERAGHSLDLDRIEFHCADLTDLLYRDRLFDLVLSINVLQKTSNPLVTLRELLRVLKPGGMAYLSFDQMWTCHSGSRYGHYETQPWAHPDDFAIQMREAGAQECEIPDFMETQNHKGYCDYPGVLSQILEAADLQKFHIKSRTDIADESSLTIDNQARAAAILNCDLGDLLMRSFLVMAIK